MKRLLFFLLSIPIALQAYEIAPRPYAKAATINFHLLAADGTLDIDETDAGTDVTLMCDNGTPGASTNVYTDEGTGYSVVLTAAEMTCARVEVHVNATVDSAFVIPTFGHPSAAIVSYEPYRFAAAADAAGTTTSTDLTGTASATDDEYNDNVLRIYDASAVEWYEALITDYVGATNVATHTTIPAAAASGDGLIVMAETKTLINASGGILEANTMQIEGLDATTQVNTEVDTAIETYKLDHLALNAESDDVADGTIIAKLATKGADWSDFVAADDSLEALQEDLFTAQAGLDAIRRTIAVFDTTIATYTDNGDFTLTAGPPDDNAIKGCMVMITDQVDSTQIAYAGINIYTGSTKRVQADGDPGTFTYAVGDLATVSCFGVTAEFMNRHDITGSGTAGDLWRGT